MEWLEDNLRLAYPFADQVTGSVTSVFADAQVMSPVVGALNLTIFDPQALTNAHVQIKHGATIVLETTTATATVLGDYTYLESQDTTRGSSFRFILSSTAVAAFANIADPIEFAPAAVSFDGGRLSSLQGLDGEVTLVFPEHIRLAIDSELNQVTVSAVDPEDRVDCSSVDCEKAFTVNGKPGDQFGSLSITNDGCHRLVPHPTEPNKLVIYNFCTPCLDCADVDELNAKFLSQADYYHQLAAIYHDQFNRYQQAVAAANAEIEDALTRSDIETAYGLIDIGGRSFNPPYFTQLFLALTNSSLYEVTIELTVTITPVEIEGQLTYVPNSGLIHRYLMRDEQVGTFSGFPGVLTVTLKPQETATLASEMHRSTVLINPHTGDWNVSALVTYLSGPGTLPDPVTITKTFPISLVGAEPTVGP